MNLYTVEQDPDDWDVYDGFVVACEEATDIERVITDWMAVQNKAAGFDRAKFDFNGIETLYIGSTYMGEGVVFTSYKAG